MKSYQEYLIERLNQEEVIEEGMKELFMPIILGAALLSNVYGKDIDFGKMKDNFMNKASELVSTGVDKVQKGLEEIGEKGSSVEDDVKDFVDDVESNMKDVLNKIKDQKMEVIVKKDIDKPIKVDIKNKKIYVKRIEDLKDLPGFEDAVKKGILFGDAVKEFMGDVDKKLQEPKAPPPPPEKKIDTRNIV